MPVTAMSSTSVEVTVGGEWVITVLVTDAYDNFVAQAPVVTVTLPDGSTATPTVTTLYAGAYRTAYAPTTAGRHVARAVATGYGAATFAAFAKAITAAAGMPDVDAVDDYLAPHSWTDIQLQQALDAESAAQRAICAVPAEYPADLREALLRRVARNLAMRPIPLAVLQGDAEVGSSVLPGSDPEVRRLEKPYLRLLVA
jgi:hypothetical protein